MIDYFTLLQYNSTLRVFYFFSFKKLIIDSNIAKVSLVGVGMRSQAGVASKAFKALSENDVNIQIICTSEIKITMVVEKDLVDKAVSVLHKEFELEK